MVTTEMGSGKTVIVLAVVVGCFGVLWPRVFYPMMQSAFLSNNAKGPNGEISDAAHAGNDRQPRAGPHPGAHPSLMEKSQQFASKSKQPLNQRGRTVGGMRPSLGSKAEVKGGGAMGLLMPLYTIGIIAFFLYTIAKLVFRSPNKDDTSLVNTSQPNYNLKNCQIDSTYRKNIKNTEFSVDYHDYIILKEQQRQQQRQKAKQSEKLTTKLLANGGRRQVFTAIEGIIAEMDEFRERLMADQLASMSHKDDKFEPKPKQKVKKPSKQGEKMESNSKATLDCHENETSNVEESDLSSNKIPKKEVPCSNSNEDNKFKDLPDCKSENHDICNGNVGSAQQNDRNTNETNGLNAGIMTHISDIEDDDGQLEYDSENDESEDEEEIAELNGQEIFAKIIS
ncbi:hypothetical protein CHUAL_013662 [Chamberlinius hualienensis]